ncbi:response regulator transcription factor [Flavobacterium aurantiibacter]|uniref:DNA-binding response regulator n=1 Tax=Flavobacterium aurantiibacter TaxID=2023067 RepID=A0A255ZB22_9FLAO|nr:response regulator transcription factor [Flavobacterium aurantiibacter]OYQ38632.1 DNA-binding response regulator [Flavobacterium aurantiibacter]
MKARILYAEDDATLAFLTQENLEENGFEVHHCTDGEQAIAAFKSENFDLCVLDIMMPKFDGFEVATEIRKQNTEVPIIFLSAKTLKEDRIRGLKLGADDYLVKPFSIEELLLKLEVFLKRSGKTTSQESFEIFGDFRFNKENYEVVGPSGNTLLTEREAALLTLFLKNKNAVLKRETILVEIWGTNDYFLGRSLDVFVSRLRKIFQSDEKVKIENLHGIGFKFVVK